MKAKLRSVVIGICLLLVACSPPISEVSISVAKPGYREMKDLERFGPDEHGIICYKYAAQTLSCVYVGVVDE